MKRTVRTTAAVLAVATTGVILQAIAALAATPRATEVVVLPRVVVVATAPAREQETPLVQMRPATRKAG